MYITGALCVQLSFKASSVSAITVPKAVADWEKKRGEYQKQFAPLVAAIKGSSIDPISLDCTQDSAKLRDTAVQRMESERCACIHVYITYIYTYAFCVLGDFHFYT